MHVFVKVWYTMVLKHHIGMDVGSLLGCTRIHASFRV